MQILSIVGLLLVGLVSTGVSQTATNCGTGNTIVLQDFSLVPHPIRVPSVATFNLQVDIKEDLADPIYTEIKLEKRILIWIKVPCTDNVGSCSYNSWCDVCKTCVCPLKAGLQHLTMHMNITSAVPTGDYRAEIYFQSATGQTGCVKIAGIKIA